MGNLFVLFDILLLDIRSVFAYISLSDEFGLWKEI